MLDIGNEKYSEQKNLTIESILSSEPSKCGYLMKKNRSILATLFPCFVQQWKKRYFILIGNFLFRFASSDSEYPKGVPIPLDAVRIQIVEKCCIEISMIRKVYLFKADSVREASDWYNAIIARKLLALKESMCHAQSTKKVQDINKSASSLFKRKLHSESVEQSNVSNPLHSLNN